jgi:hypothetical protein
MSDADPMGDNEKKLLIALVRMVEQYLPGEDPELDHLFMSAGESAIEALAAYGLVVPEPRGGRWTEAGIRFRNSC